MLLEIVYWIALEFIAMGNDYLAPRQNEQKYSTASTAAAVVDW